MTFEHFLAAARARWKVPVSIFVVFVSLAVLATVLLPKKYTATGEVLIDSRSPDPITGMVMQQTPTYLGTQADIIQSARVAKLVVRQLKMTESAELRARWQDKTDGQGDFESWVQEVLLNALEIKPGKNSNTMEVNFTAVDPKFATVVANAFIKAYIDINLELRTDPAKQFGSMFDAQLARARQRLDDAQRKLSEFQQANGIIVTDERLDVEMARLNELSGQLVAMQSATAEAVSRSSQSGINSPDTNNSNVVMGLKADLARQVARLEELSSIYGEKHPEVQRAKALIEEYKRRIQVESASVGRTAGVNVDIARQRESQVRASVEAQRTRVLKMKELRNQASLLERDVESAQKAYDGIQARTMQTSLESQTNQTNVSVLRYATEPYRPSSPKILLFLIQGVFLGIFLGSWAVVLLEQRDRRVRLDGDLQELVGVHLLGEIPSAPKVSSRKLPIAFTPKLPAKAVLRLPSSSAKS